MAWFAVRSVVVFDAGAEDGRDIYEERVCLFEAADAEVAIARAEVEVSAYAALFDDATALGFHQSYALAEEIGDGAEVFSLMRDSDLQPDDFLDRFFDTGDERQRPAG